MISVSSLINLINSLITILATSFLALFPHQTPIPAHNQTPVYKIATPSSRLQPRVVPTSQLVKTAPTPIVTDHPVPWGQTQKIGDHEYRTYVGSEPQMGTPDEILAALNIYRKNHQVGSVRADENICKLAKTRADQQQNLGTLDSHKGLIDYMNDQAHWRYLDIKAIGENASYGYVLSGTHLIEWVFDSDSEHRENQLNPTWNLACAGVSGVTVDIIFGQR